jgi:hypothetical protein
VAYFDKAVSPGGTGRIRITLDLKGYEGLFFKSATVITNDPQYPSILLHLKGRARPLVELRPSPLVEFKGGGQEQSEKSIDLTASTQPFRILRIETTVKDRLKIHLQTIVPGKHYRLIITNLQKKEKFSTLVRCFTDLPQKPEIQIPVYYHPDVRNE